MPKFNAKKAHEEESEPIGQLIVGKKTNILKIEAIPNFINNCVLTDLDDTNCIKKFVKFARSSNEYQRYFRYLKQNLDMTRCSYLPYVTTGLGGLHIELHHSPFTMFDITKAVCARCLEEYGSANEFDVAEEVMMLHYENLVGLIPVSPTVHELIHSEAFDVHPGLTYGYWKEFVKRYRKYFTEDLELKLKDLEAWEDVPKDRIPEMLNIKYTMLQYEGLPLYKTLSIEDKSSVMNELQQSI